MEVPRPTKLEDLEALRIEMKQISLDAGCLIIVMVVSAVVLATFLLIIVPDEKVWPLLRPFWSPERLIVAFIIGLLPLAFYIFPQFRARKAREPLFAAVRGFDQAQLEYEKWQDTSEQHFLMQSYEHISIGRGWLDEIAEYSALQKKIAGAYRPGIVDPSDESKSQLPN